MHEYADSQFGHIFASGPTREEARRALVMALKETFIMGEIRTTVEYLNELLETEVRSRDLRACMPCACMQAARDLAVRGGQSRLV